MTSKEIASARALIGNHFEKIAQMCNLIPVNSWKVWKDEFGNELTFGKRKVKINKKKYKYQIKDLYIKSKLKEVLQISYSLLVINYDHFDIYFCVGSDGVLRVRDSSDNVIPVLLFGFEVLEFISKNYLEEYKEIQNLEIFSNFNKTLPKSGYITVYPTDNIIKGLPVD